MKRYISSIVIIAIMFCTIGAFYIYTAAANSLPEVKIVKVSGNDDELKNVVISGNYHIGNTNENFEATKKGTTYFSERSIFERLDLEKGKLLELRKNYRNFMRGKHDLDSIYEDNELLIYTELNPRYNKYSLDFSILNKKNKKKNSFKVEIPNYKEFTEVYFHDVQRVGNELKVITENNRRSDQDKNKIELHVYTIDYEQKKIMKDDIIASKFMGNEHTGYQYVTIYSTDPTITNKYFAIQDNDVKVQEHQDGGIDEQIVKSEIVTYNYEKEKIEKIKVPKQYYDAQIVNDKDGTIYFILTNEKDVIVSKVNIDKHSVEKIRKISLPEMGGNQHQVIKINNGKIYILTSKADANDKNTFFVMDIRSGQNLYQGKITQSKQKKNSNIELFDFEIN
ncbi:hypothetical protein B5V88_05865 [Heyndrickxia sporothermodurans]|uniref:Lactonase family protein n=2 Tax=Heyndrickxia sporothermodurans TaxID=46224 RepID=A0AB37HIA8_9BACI|nr:hypothetical protein [Heyndrickxia sporothermodurans]MBL5767418.1 hypothetical protein [Heyndrickxia sporothermodurans]MBL5770768.1 hypothetical protein [Heyndrickxia sporothermodurans]MBL5774530.1 hypothetical protein [Heyndrickxia sporothermodurans]MBL5777891.1 hypothetical protein [Heyndrickxia sporothermodurans]MBL5781794.1 hypothetical protein [Heyndrickxia sporothermodurans]